jgi:hypothetical protein
MCRSDINDAGQNPLAQQQVSTPPSPSVGGIYAELFPSIRAMILSHQENRFHITIQNSSDTTLDVWWVPMEGTRQRPKPIQYNIRPGTVRRINVGKTGDRFTLAEHTWGYHPLMEFQANTPESNITYTGN